MIEVDTVLGKIHFKRQDKDDMINRPVKQWDGWVRISTVDAGMEAVTSLARGQ